MDDLRFYIAVFKRRLPYFLVVATIVSAVAVIVAFTLPPAYESRMVLLVESPQIPEDLASSTVRTPAVEQLQIIEQRVFTRNNMLEIAREFNVLPDLAEMSPDEIVNAMHSRTRIITSAGGFQQAPVMNVFFEAPAAHTTAEVLNAYLDLILQQDTEFRKGRSGETLDFFSQEIERLGKALDVQSARILEFKQANTDALPESLEFRMDLLSDLQEGMSDVDREIIDLRSQRTRLVQLYELTGGVDEPDGPTLSVEEQQLQELNAELQTALAIYAPDHPRVRLLETRISQLEASIAAAPPVRVDEASQDSAPELPAVLQIQLTEVDDSVASMEKQKIALQARIDDLSNSIERTTEVTSVLEEMTRQYETIELQFNTAEQNLSAAQIGDRIESRSRGQRISVIEQPSVPDVPTKPSRKKLAAAGTALGVLSGLALIALMEILNTSARRPEDIINRFGVTPLTTIPYIQTRGERFRQRSLKFALVIIILVGVPAAVFAVHTYYLPLDLIADQVMDRLGVRL